MLNDPAGRLRKTRSPSVDVEERRRRPGCQSGAGGHSSPCLRGYVRLSSRRRRCMERRWAMHAVVDWWWRRPGSTATGRGALGRRRRPRAGATGHCRRVRVRVRKAGCRLAESERYLPACLPEALYNIYSTFCSYYLQTGAANEAKRGSKEEQRSSALHWLDLTWSCDRQSVSPVSLRPVVSSTFLTRHDRFSD